MFDITKLAEWCWTVIPSDGIFNLHQTTIMDSFSCILSFWQLHLSYFTQKYLHALFYQFHTEISTFSVKKRSVEHLYATLALKLLAENAVKTSQRQPNIMHFLALVSHIEIPVGYARKKTLVLVSYELYILNQTYNATRMWLDFCMNMWCRAVYLRCIAQLLTKNLWCTVRKVSTAWFGELISDWSEQPFGSQVLARG